MDKHYQLPCGECNGYYGHHHQCSAHTESGIFEALVIKQVEERFVRKHQDILRELKQKDEIIEKQRIFINSMSNSDNFMFTEKDAQIVLKLARQTLKEVKDIEFKSETKQESELPEL